MSKLKKTLSMFISLVMVLSVLSYLSITASAESDAPSGNFITFSGQSIFYVSISTYFDGELEYLNDFTSNEWDTTDKWESVATETSFSGERIGDTGNYYLCFRGTGNTRISSDESFNSDNWGIYCGTSVACSGNIESLLDYTAVANGEHPTMGSNCFAYMFENCTCLTSAPELPATTLSESCYRYMFMNCSALTTAPELPATTLPSYCYNYMFYGCRNLTAAPSLSATTLTEHCYESMFYDCTSLTVVPELPATVLADNCYYSMFSGCSGLKLYTSASEISTPSPIEWGIPAEVNTNGLTDWNSNMFSGTGGSFTGVPEIGVTYYYPNPMFNPKSFNLTGTFQEGELVDTVFSVELTWGAMEFTYTGASQGVWNPTTLKFENQETPAWSCEADANKITVKNRSNAAINAGFAFTPEEGIVGGFYDEASGGSEIDGNTLALASAAPVGEETVGTEQIGTAYLHITSGSLTSGQTAVKIGRITVTITD